MLFLKERASELERAREAMSKKSEVFFSESKKTYPSPLPSSLSTPPPPLPRPLSLPQRYSVASSSDGTRLAAAAASTGGTGGGLYLSSNGGASWSLAPGVLTGSVNMQAAALSSNGSVVVGVVNGGNVWISTDSGASFAPQTGAPTVANYKSVAVSSTGQKIVAGVQSGNLWTSTDYGATFATT